MIPFKPEIIENLIERFPKALEKVWEVTEHMSDRPGLHREHLFDFGSGMRLLISRDSFRNDAPEIHISASWEWAPPFDVKAMREQVIKGYHQLGGKGLPIWVGFSSGGIPHWIIPAELEDMKLNITPEKLAINECNEESCNEKAVHMVYWPGQNPPPKYCRNHAQKALRIAMELGVNLVVEEMK